MSSTVQVIKRTAKGLFTEYLEKSITHGLRMIKRTEGDSYGRYIWLALMAYVLIITHVDIYQLLVQFVQAPTETRLSPKVVHIKNVLFPAIAICSNNQFSKEALTNYSNQLFEQQQRLHPNLVANTSTELAEHILRFSGFLLLPFDSHPIINENLRNLHVLLTAVHGNETYSMRNTVWILAPKCENIMKRCALFGKELNCNDIFHMRATSLGFCCIYNYRRTSNNPESISELLNTGKRNKAVRFKTTGASNSLLVVVQDNPDDFVLKAFPFNGFTALVFHTDDYPDADSGTVIKRLVSYDREYEIPLQPVIVEGSPRIRQFPANTRRCYFPEEGEDVLKQHYYSFNECFLDCQFRSLLNHCGCTLPLLPTFERNVPNCVLLDLPCIELWKGIWWQWNSFDYIDEKRKSASSLELCDHCLPSCNIMSYRSYENSRPLNQPSNGSEYKAGILSGLSTDKPTAVIKFFYKSAFSQVQTHDISGDWIVLLGRYGGICSIMYGFSFVGIIEIFYFVSGKWFVMWWRMFKECYANWLRRKKEGENHQELYWDELKPKYGFSSQDKNVA